MTTQSNQTPKFAGRRQAPGLFADVADLVRTLKTLLDPYRPELHYMRGPGPAWHAKHDLADAGMDGAVHALVRVKA